MPAAGIKSYFTIFDAKPGFIYNCKTRIPGNQTSVYTCSGQATEKPEYGGDGIVIRHSIDLIKGIVQLVPLQDQGGV